MMLKKLLILAAASGAMSAFAAAEPAAQPAARPKALAHELTRAEFEQLLTQPNELLIIDLRRPDELTRIGGFPVYLSIQAKDLEQQLAWIPKDRTIVTVSNHAARSGRAADLLTAKGFKVAGLLGAQTYEEQGGKLTKIEVPPPRTVRRRPLPQLRRRPRASNSPDEGPRTRRVWDLPVRIVHWLLVIGIAGSYATHKLGVAYFRYHLWFGYLVVVLGGVPDPLGFRRHAPRAFREIPSRAARHVRYLAGAAARRRARDAGSQSARRLDGDLPAAVVAGAGHHRPVRQ